MFVLDGGINGGNGISRFRRKYTFPISMKNKIVNVSIEYIHIYEYMRLLRYIYIYILLL